MRQQTQPPVNGSRDEFCAYLRSHRDRAEMSLDQIARVTRIPVHSLEHLEQGRFEDLPADVFVRGFLRSYAKCVGFDADAAIRAYASCGLAPAPVSSEMADEVLRTMPVRDSGLEAGESVRSVPAQRGAGSETDAAEDASEIEAADDSAEDRAPAVSARAAESARGERGRGSARKRSRRRRRRTRNGAPAERHQATAQPESDRPADGKSETRHRSQPSAARGTRSRPKRQLTFLPPSFGEEESGRRGPLTLAVIILVIIATLTMSYLLRRPGSSADGYTAVPTQQDDMRA